MSFNFLYLFFEGTRHFKKTSNISLFIFLIFELFSYLSQMTSISIRSWSNMETHRFCIREFSTLEVPTTKTKSIGNVPTHDHTTAKLASRHRNPKSWNLIFSIITTFPALQKCQRLKIWKRGKLIKKIFAILLATHHYVNNHWKL